MSLAQSRLLVVLNSWTVRVFLLLQDLVAVCITPAEEEGDYCHTVVTATIIDRSICEAVRKDGVS